MVSKIKTIKNQRSEPFVVEKNRKKSHGAKKGLFNKH